MEDKGVYRSVKGGVFSPQPNRRVKMEDKGVYRSVKVGWGGGVLPLPNGTGYFSINLKLAKMYSAKLLKTFF